MLRNIKLLITLFVIFIAAFYVINSANAEDCTGTLPGADCTLDEDTTAPLTIDSGITLTVGGSVLIGHEIDADDLAGDGVITTFGLGNNITQSADIGSNTSINDLIIADDNIWTTSAAIITDSGGIDIDLGAVDGGEVLNFISGGSYVGEIDGNNADTVNFGSDAAGGSYVTNGQIEAVTLIVTSGDFTVNNTLGGGIGLGGFTITDGASVQQNANITTSGALDLDGTLTISSGSLLSANTYVADADSGTIVIEVGRSAGIASIGQFSIAAGGPLDLSNDNVQISLDPTSQLLISETVSNAFIGNTGAAIGPAQFQGSSILYNFSLQPNGNNFDLVIAVTAASDITSTDNNLVVANALLASLAGTTSSQINQVQTSLASAPSAAVFNEKLESLQPTVDGGFITASLSTSNKMSMMAMNRVGTLYDKKQTIQQTKKLISGSKNLKTGRRIKEEKKYVVEEKGSVWGKPYIHKASQTSKDDIDGFSTSTSGVIFGADSGKMNDDILIGLALLAGDANVKSKNANSTDTEISSYGASLYGGTKISAKTLVSGSLSYVYSTNTVTRKDLGGIINNDVTGEYPTQHIALNSNLSHKYKTINGFVITPSLSFNYDYLNTDKYTEVGSTDLAMSVDYDAISMMALGLGVDVDYQYKTQAGIILHPSAYMKYKYDFLNDGIEARSNYKGAPNLQIVTKGFEPQRSILNIGTGIEAELAKDWKLALGYDFEYKDKYSSHTGHINALHNF